MLLLPQAGYTCHSTPIQLEYMLRPGLPASRKNVVVSDAVEELRSRFRGSNESKYSLNTLPYRSFRNNYMFETLYTYPVLSILCTNNKRKVYEQTYLSLAEEYLDF
jgi:hypothetical protein